MGQRRTNECAQQYACARGPATCLTVRTLRYVGPQGLPDDLKQRSRYGKAHCSRRPRPERRPDQGTGYHRHRICDIPPEKRSSHSKDAKWAVASEQGGKSTEESNADAPPQSSCGILAEELSMAKSARLPTASPSIRGRPLQSRSRCLLPPGRGLLSWPSAGRSSSSDRPPFGAGFALFRTGP